MVALTDGNASVATRIARGFAARGLQRIGRPSPQRVLFNSFYGQFSDSPRAIYEELLRRGATQSYIWLYRGRDRPPPGITPVTPYAIDYLREAGRAGYVVANVQMPENYRKRPGTVFLQTWHGTPLKRIGLDNDRWKANPRGLARMVREYAKWDFLVSQSPYSTEILRRAFGFEGEVLETGYPRNDALSAGDGPARRKEVREALGIREGARAVLYAPTWRDNLVKSGSGFTLSIDVERMADRLGSDHVLLLRLHRLLDPRFGDVVGDFGRNVSDYPDIRELYLAADVMITDYSSAMFDFAVTGKPMLFFTADLEEYRDDVRGFYFDLEAEAPGPVCRTSDELIAALEDISSLHAAGSERYARFRERFCPFDDGRAAARVVDRVFPSA